ILHGIEMPLRELEDDADDLILHEAEPLGAAPPAAILQQQLLRLGPARRQRRLEALRHRLAQVVLAPGMGFDELFERGRDGVGVEQLAGWSWAAICRGEHG